MSENKKIKSFAEAKAALNGKAVMGEETIQKAISAIEEMPEVGLMAQIIAMEEETAKIYKEINAKEKNLLETNKNIEIFQNELVQMELNFRKAIMTEKNEDGTARGVAALMAKFGDQISKYVTIQLEVAKKEDAAYISKAEALQNALKHTKELTSLIEAKYKTADAVKTNQKKVEEKLNKLLKPATPRKRTRKGATHGA